MERSTQDAEVVERLLAGGDLHDLFRTERVLRESHEQGDLVLLMQVARGAADSPPAVVVLKSHETLLQPRHADAVLRPSTRFVPLSHNDVYAAFGELNLVTDARLTGWTLPGTTSSRQRSSTWVPSGPR